MLMEVLGSGLSRTGTTSLAAALNTIGYKTLHYAPEAIEDIVEGKSSDLKLSERYFGCDAVTDIPAAFFFEEFLEQYPNIKVVHTERPEDSWLRSMKSHYQRLLSICPSWPNCFEARLHQCVYGSEDVNEFVYLKKYREHNRRVLQIVPSDQLLVMDITKGDGWEKLCSFLDKPVPSLSFPYLNILEKRNLKVLL